MKIRNLVCLCLLLLVIYSCGISKKPSAVPMKHSTECAYRSFSSQYKGSYNGIPFKLQCRVSHDSIFWVSLSSILGELGRVQIAQDSLWVLDKINSEAYIVSKNKVEAVSNRRLDNVELERFLTDSTATDFVFGIDKPFEAAVEMKKRFDKDNTPVIDIQASKGSQQFRFSIIQSSIDYNEPQQYPFTIPNKYSIKPL